MPARRLLPLALALAAVLGLGVGASGGPAHAATDPGGVNANGRDADGLVTHIEFIGDSVTGSPGCWRAAVWVNLTDAGHAVDMVGSRTADECGGVTNAAGETWDPDNTGIGGITTTRMWVKLARDQILQATQPQVIVQLLGTNDLLGGASADDILAQYDKLLELYRDVDPAVSVVVGTPTPIEEGKCGCGAAQAALAAALPAWAAQASTAQSPVTIADLSTGYDVATDTVDGIHPSDTGNAKLAAAWTPVIDAAIVAHAQAATPTATAPPSPTAHPAPASGASSPWVGVWIAVGAGVAVALGAVVYARRHHTVT